MRVKGLIAATALIMTCTPAQAQEGTSNPFTAPDCEFTLDFPTKPATSDGATIYAKRYNDGSLLNVRVHCNRLDKGTAHNYTADIMKSLLASRAHANNINNFQTDSQDIQTTRQAVLLAQTAEGPYMSQMWAGESSLFTLESNVTGPVPSDAQEALLFIVQSVRPVDKNTAAEQQEEPAKDE